MFAVIVITDLKVLFLNVETFQSPSLILNHRATWSDLSSGSTREMAREVRMESKRKAKGSNWGLKRRDQAGGVGSVTEPVTEYEMKWALAKSSVGWHNSSRQPTCSYL